MAPMSLHRRRLSRSERQLEQLLKQWVTDMYNNHTLHYVRTKTESGVHQRSYYYTNVLANDINKHEQLDLTEHNRQRQLGRICTTAVDSDELLIGDGTAIDTSGIDNSTVPLRVYFACAKSSRCCNLTCCRSLGFGPMLLASLVMTLIVLGIMWCTVSIMRRPKGTQPINDEEHDYRNTTTVTGETNQQVVWSQHDLVGSHPDCYNIQNPIFDFESENRRESRDSIMLEVVVREGNHTVTPVVEQTTATQSD